MIINKCPDLKRKYKIKTHLVCKFIQGAHESSSLRRCGMEAAFTAWILKGKWKNNRVVCVATHYSALIPSNAVWSLEAGTFISCLFFFFFCFHQFLIETRKKNFNLEAESRGGQKTAGEVENWNVSGRQFLTCLHTERRWKEAGKEWHWCWLGVGSPGVWDTNHPGEWNVPGPGSRWEPFQGPQKPGRKSANSLWLQENTNRFQMVHPPPHTPWQPSVRCTMKSYMFHEAWGSPGSRKKTNPGNSR